MTTNYKVLTIVEELGDYTTLRVELYSLKANSWKRLPNVETYFRRYGHSNRDMVFLNGALHFIATRESSMPKLVILGFDLGDEVFPECMQIDLGNRFLWKFEESLSVLWIRSKETASELEIWVMKKYGVEESWSLVSRVWLGGYPFKWCFNGSLQRKNGHVLLSFTDCETEYSTSQMILHDVKSQETKYLGYLNQELTCCFLGTFVESLILLDKGNDLSNPAFASFDSPNDASVDNSASNPALTSSAEGTSGTNQAFITNFSEDTSSYVAGPLVECVFYDFGDEESSDSGEDLNENSREASQNINAADASEDTTNDVAVNHASLDDSFDGLGL